MRARARSHSLFVRCSCAARALFVRVRVRCSRVVRAALFVRCSYKYEPWYERELELTRELRDAPVCKISIGLNRESGSLGLCFLYTSGLKPEQDLIGSPKKLIHR
jgi:hypothetical protein